MFLLFPDFYNCLLRNLRLVELYHFFVGNLYFFLKLLLWYSFCLWCSVVSLTCLDLQYPILPCRMRTLLPKRLRGKWGTLYVGIMITYHGYNIIILCIIHTKCGCTSYTAKYIICVLYVTGSEVTLQLCSGKKKRTKLKA